MFSVWTSMKVDGFFDFSPNIKHLFESAFNCLVVAVFFEWMNEWKTKLPLPVKTIDYVPLNFHNVTLIEISITWPNLNMA